MMRENRETVASLRDEDLIEVFSRRLPDLLERRPELEPEIYRVFLKTFARRDEVALVMKELREFRAQTEQRFTGVEQRLDVVEQRLDKLERALREFRAEVAAGFEEVHRTIDRLGARWGIRSESVFRKTMAALLEKSFGVRVEQRTIAGEQFDVIVYDHQHVLVEIAASVGRTIGVRLERKRRLYEEHTGERPARIILATASIHSHRAQQLRQDGIEVIEPEEPEQDLVK